MLNKPLFIILITLTALLTQCLRLDPFLFFGKKIPSYKLDSYTGKQECIDATSFLNSVQITPPLYKEICLSSGIESIYGILIYKDSISLNTKPCILYLHGNALHIDFYWKRARLLSTTGCSVFIIDYRGFGKSSGTPTEQGIYQDGRTALSYIIDTLAPVSIIVHAYSLGTLIGCELGSTLTADKLSAIILEAPIGSISTLVNDGSFLSIPSSYVTTYTGDNVTRARFMTIPLLLLYASKDDMLDPKTHAIPLWNNYGNQTQSTLIEAHGALHATIPQTVGYKAYCDMISLFIANHASH